MKSKQKIRNVLGKYQRLPNARPGLLGNGAGIVDDSRNQGHSYVRIGNSPAISVVNKRCASLNDLPVWVGYDPLEPETLQILSIRSYKRVGENGLDQSPQVGTHAITHRYFERDTVYSDLRQLMPFRPLLDGTMILQVNHGISFLGGMWRGIEDNSIDMSPYVPATGSLYTLVYYGSTGTLQVDVGPVKDLNTLLPSNAPIPTAGTIPVALLRLWSGMSGMYENRTATDLADPRWMGLYGGTGGGSGTSSSGTFYSSVTYLTSGVSNPLTESDLETIIGTPAGIGAGKLYHINDEGLYLHEYLALSDGSFWWTVPLTKTIQGDFITRLSNGVVSAELFTVTGGINEFDLIYANGNYHLFYSTYNATTGYTHHRSASSIAGLSSASDTVLFNLCCPTAQYIGTSWHVWATPLGGGTYYHYTSSIPNGSYTLIDSMTTPCNDLSVRFRSIDNYYYATYVNTPTTWEIGLLKSLSPNGPWTDLGLIGLTTAGWYTTETDPAIFFIGEKAFISFGGYDGSTYQKVGIFELNTSTWQIISTPTVLISPTASWMQRGNSGRIFNPVWLEQDNKLYFSQNPGYTGTWYTTVTGWASLSLGAV